MSENVGVDYRKTALDELKRMRLAVILIGLTASEDFERTFFNELNLALERTREAVEKI